MPNATKESDEYLQHRKIPELFQSLTIALLYNQPQDHVDYLIKCLDEVKANRNGAILWDSFLPADRSQKSNQPLPNVRGTLNPGAKQ